MPASGVQIRTPVEPIRKRRCPVRPHKTETVDRSKVVTVDRSATRETTNGAAPLPIGQPLTRYCASGESSDVGSGSPKRQMQSVIGNGYVLSGIAAPLAESQTVTWLPVLASFG